MLKQLSTRELAERTLQKDDDDDAMVDLASLPLTRAAIEKKAKIRFLQYEENGWHIDEAVIAFDKNRQFVLRSEYVSQIKPEIVIQCDSEFKTEEYIDIVVVVISVLDLPKESLGWMHPSVKSAWENYAGERCDNAG
jgi:hypothetical protein